MKFPKIDIPAFPSHDWSYQHLPNLNFPNVSGPMGNGFGNNVDPSNGLTNEGAKESFTDFQAFYDALRSGNPNDLLNGHLSLSNEQYDAFYQFLMQWFQIIDQRKYDRQLTLDQREFDWNRLLDERNYDSPSAQLMRLMSTGMSRDAALAAISAGMNGGSGVGGSGQPVVSPVASAPSVSAPSGTTGVAIANAVIDGIGTIIQGVQAGFSMAESIENVKSLQMQNFMSQEALQGYKDVKDVAMYLQNLSSSDEDFNQMLSQFSNADDLFKYISDHKDTNNFKSLYSSPIYQRTLGTPNGRSLFNDYWKSIRDTRDSGTLMDEYVNQQRLQNAATRVDISKASAEIELIGSQKDLTEQKMIESCYEVAKLNAETYQQEVETSFFIDTYDSNVELANATSQSATAQAGINTRLFELNEAGFPMLKEVKMQELKDELRKWATITNPKVLKQRIKTWKLDAENEQMDAYLHSIHNNAVGKFSQKHPSLWEFVVGWTAMTGSAPDPAGTAEKTVGTFGTIVKAIKTMPK